RHHGNERHVVTADHLDVWRQGDVAQVLRVVDLQPGNIDIDRFRNGLGRADHVDRVIDDVDGAAALDARRLIGVEHVDRYLHANFCAFGNPHEVDMHGQVVDRVELEVARNDAVLRPIDIEIVERGEKAPRVNA